MSMPKALPESVVRLLWDVEPAAVNLDRHKDYVMERVMSRGDWAAMQWLRETYDRDELADFLRRKGRVRLPARELAYWALITGAIIEADVGGGRPRWAGP